MNTEQTSKHIFTYKEYRNMIRPFLRDIINDHETEGE